MMYITITRIEDSEQIINMGLHVGEKRKFIDFFNVDSHPSIKYDYVIQADGDELERIRHHWPAFVGKKPVQKFYGDFARQILSSF